MMLITLGITPTRPDTGYGYIQFVEKREDYYKVKTFTEKPN
jgi:mannose-1-phosphate guanylyltransferase